MVSELSREEVSSRLTEIFSSSMEGEELDKALGSIEKRLDKFEGKWGGLLKWAEQKYGKAEEASQEDSAGQDKQLPDSHHENQNLTDNSGPTKILLREEAYSKLESIFRANLKGEELEKMVGSIDKRLDKFEGKWPKLILWAEEKFGSEQEKVGSEQEKVGSEQEKVGSEQEKEDSDQNLSSSPSSTSEISKTKAEETLELIVAGDNVGALNNLKGMISESPKDSDSWLVASSYFSSIGFSGRAKACEER